MKILISALCCAITLGSYSYTMMDDSITTLSDLREHLRNERCESRPGYSTFDYSVLCTVQGKIQFLQLSPDKKTIFIATGKKKAYLYSLATGQQESVFREEDPIVIGAFSPQGNLLATGSQNGTITIWSLPLGLPTTTWKKDQASITALSFNPRKPLILIGSSNGTIECRFIETGEPYCSLKGHTDSINSLCFSNNGLYALSSSEDGTARFFSLFKKKEIKKLEQLEEGIRSAHFESDETIIATKSKRGIGKLWSSQYGTILLQQYEYSPHKENSIYSPSRKLILQENPSEKGFCLYSTDRQYPRKLITLHETIESAHSVIFSKDEHSLVIGTSQGKVYLLNRHWLTLSGDD